MKSLACWYVTPLLPILALGCEVTPEKIQVWKNSENGPPKLRAAVRDEAQPSEIRVLAATALAELGHFDPLKEDLRSLDDGDRKSLAGLLTKEQLARMRGASPQATSELQIHAKDTLFTLREVVGPGDRDALLDELVRWVLGDWSARRRGEHSGEKIVLARGEAAGPELVRRLTADIAAVGHLAQLLAKVGGPADREAGTARLVELAKKQKPAHPETLRALATMGVGSGRRYLLSLARGRGPAAARAAALEALALVPDPALVGPMAEIAGDDKEIGDLREWAFAVLDRIASEQTLEALGPLMAAKEEVVRYRAAEAAVKCCGAKGVAKLLRTLPSRYAYPEQDVKDYIEKDVSELGSGALPVLREALTWDSWLARVVALRLLARMGGKEDLPRLENLANDSTRLSGWASKTVGGEARAAIERLKKRL